MGHAAVMHLDSKQMSISVPADNLVGVVPGIDEPGCPPRGTQLIDHVGGRHPFADVLGPREPAVFLVSRRQQDAEDYQRPGNGDAQDEPLDQWGSVLHDDADRGIGSWVYGAIYPMGGVPRRTAARGSGRENTRVHVA